MDENVAQALDILDITDFVDELWEGINTYLEKQKGLHQIGRHHFAINNATVAKEGKYMELMEKGCFYAELFNKQKNGIHAWNK